MRLFLNFLVTLFFLSVAHANETACSETSGNSALVIIDMQPFFARGGGDPDNAENLDKLKQITREQVAAVEQARANGIPIVLIEYFHEQIQLGETNDTLKAAVAGYSSVRTIKKTQDGMFSTNNQYLQDLVSHLQKHQIGTLIVAGANGNACVKQSILGAFRHNCNVVAYNKGIADFNHRSFIYPFAGRYSQIKPECMNCTFREVSSLDEVTKYMINNNTQTPKVDRTLNQR